MINKKYSVVNVIIIVGGVNHSTRNVQFSLHRKYVRRPRKKFSILLAKMVKSLQKFSQNFFDPFFSWVRWKGRPEEKENVPAIGEWIFISFLQNFSILFSAVKVFLVAFDTTLLKLDRNLNWSECRIRNAGTLSLAPFAVFRFQCRLLITAPSIRW